MPGPEARAVPCPLCNEKFFPASLPFHQKQCEKRMSKRVVPCPYCKTEIKQIDLPNHVQVCPKAKGGSRTQTSRAASGGPESRGRGGGGGGGASQPPERSAGPAQFEPHMTEDGRMRCVYCGRYFTQDRIDKHQGICGNLKNARPKGVDGQPTQTAAKVFDAKAARTGSGPAYVSPEQYEKRQERRAQEIRKEQEQRKAKSTWRHQHQQFLDAARAGRGEEEDEPAQQLASRSSSRPHNDGKIPCPHCERRFAPDAAERHIPICANVQNRPRAPPSPSPSRASPARGHPPRPPSGSGGLSPHSARRRQAPSSSPKPRSRDRSEPPVELPALNSTMRTTVQSNSSSGSSRGFTSGTGMKAARSLKRLDSQSRLPDVDKTGRSGSNDSKGSRGASPSRSRSQRIVTHSEDMDRTMLVDDDADHMQSQLEVQRDRLDVQRSAMMLRLLRQVPPEALKQELSDVGVSCADLDKEGMVQAMVKQLS
eukprot:TRINITY_DN75133_c0_g1_i1.p1 TRINITY_DN75133_c0_g1~~TRINITY_DN75133_c0_g1_i1.p1  ORF type:complete len:481 (-),score=80.96 TRINITY_DN75133_c0_g1_i1:47-1489(-)